MNNQTVTTNNSLLKRKKLTVLIIDISFLILFFIAFLFAAIREDHLFNQFKTLIVYVVMLISLVIVPIISLTGINQEKRYGYVLSAVNSGVMIMMGIVISIILIIRMLYSGSIVEDGVNFSKMNDVLIILLLISILILIVIPSIKLFVVRNVYNRLFSRDL